jgi:sigma-B regulation protein RsbU (phosphoserine phosphatase)
MNVREEEYGEERLMNCISRHSDLSSREMVERITADVSKFAGSQPQHDDITIVVMRVLD